MATKTLILRPISAEVAVASSNNKSSMSVTPSGTSADMYHNLLSEEVADNDSTYIAIAGGYYIDVQFDSLPQDINIKDIKIMITARTPSGNTGTVVMTYNFYKIVNGTSEAIESSNISTDVAYGDISAGYTQFVCKSSSFTQELITTPALNYKFRLVTNTSSNVKVSVTQIYAEVTYEESNTIYINNNGIWDKFLYRIYQKVNDAWVETDNNALIEGERFNLNLIE